MELQQAKPVYFGCSGDLTKSKRTHKQMVMGTIISEQWASS